MEWITEFCFFPFFATSVCAFTSLTWFLGGVLSLLRQSASLAFPPPPPRLPPSSSAVMLVILLPVVCVFHYWTISLLLSFLLFRVFRLRLSFPLFSVILPSLKDSHIFIFIHFSRFLSILLYWTSGYFYLSFPLFSLFLSYLLFKPLSYTFTFFHFLMIFSFLLTFPSLQDSQLQSFIFFSYLRYSSLSFSRLSIAHVIFELQPRSKSKWRTPTLSGE